ncbi:MAG: hypothetical protein K0Q48_1928 [Bacillota bacterium]|jgi:hypothetical protein|nr:hypothetical protein [Bacillota bacterium]MDF3001809.1 hypothetical protein [Bacillota bacterium]
MLEAFLFNSTLGFFIMQDILLYSANPGFIVANSSVSVISGVKDILL